MAYIKTAGQGGCFLCTYRKQKSDEKNLIVLRGKSCFSILNRFPYNTGHLLVAPYAHRAKLGALTPSESVELWELTARMQAALDQAVRPHGYNIGINLGRVAGAGLPGHLHLHVVPRWNGDTNFMPVTGGAKVMPMALKDMHRALRRALQRRDRS
jgi:ATP adenylyltransferase